MLNNGFIFVLHQLMNSSQPFPMTHVGDNVSRKHAGPWPINGRVNSGISKLGSQFESPTKTTKSMIEAAKLRNLRR